MVEVLINGNSVELVSPRVKYTKQVNDFFDISSLVCSYTPYIKAKKTPKNTQLFEGLGIIGDTSTFPYRKNDTQLIDNGIVLIEKGNAVVKETNSEYKLFIQDGIIDVFKIMENRSVGEDLNLEELEHNKTAETIINSWQNISPYRYLISDYNGKTNDGFEINQQYQIPSVNWKFLWDKLFDLLGYTYSGDFSFIEDKWITYPKAPEIEEQNIIPRVKVTSESYDGNYTLSGYKDWGNFQLLDSITTIAPQNWRFRINLTGNYRIKFQAFGSMDYENTADNFYPDLNEFPFKIFLIKNNNQLLRYDFSFPYNINSDYYQDTFQSGDILEFIILPLANDDWETMFFYADLSDTIKLYLSNGIYQADQLHLDFLSVEIDSTGIENIDFGSAFQGLSLKDFFKETIIRGGLTPFTDNIKRHIDFIPMSDRLNLDQYNVLDWSDKYVRRITEKYTYGSYAQRNEYKLKYNNEEDSYNDGTILIDNRNLEDVKTLFTSKFYAPDQGLEAIYYKSNERELMPKVRMWEKEIKIDENDNQIIEYKPLNNRFYVLKAEIVNDSITINGETANEFYKASISGTRFNDILDAKYAILNRVFDRTKIHEIELALTTLDVSQLDLKKPFYFKQENQFYLLNRLSYESGKTCKGEFIRVRNI